MVSCLLYHGPGAEKAALGEAHCLGRLLEAPIGAEGLKVDEARHVVELLSSVPVGTQRGVVVVGPIDLANEKAADVLLKSIEEFDGRFVQPILWAHDLGGVTKTIRSRCLDRWAPSLDQEEDELLTELGFSIVENLREGSLWRIPALVKGYLEEHKGGEYDLLRAVSEAISSSLEGDEMSRLWRRIREVAVYRNPTKIEVIAALLPDPETS